MLSSQYIPTIHRCQHLANYNDLVVSCVTLISQSPTLLNCNKVVMNGWDDDTSTQKVAEYFSAFGRVLHVEFQTCSHSKRSIVTFQHQMDAALAIVELKKINPHAFIQFGTVKNIQ